LTTAQFTAVDLDAAHVAYVRQQLALHGAGGRLLGRRVLERGLGEGRLWAMVPVARAAESAADLEFDAIRSDEERNALMVETARTLRPLLEQAAPSMLVLEWCNPVEYLSGGLDHAFLVSDSEFQYATAADEDDVIADVLGGALWFPTVGVIGAAPSGVELPGTRELTPEHVEEILDGLRLVLVGAWDADGYVFWEPAQRARGVM
jgi:hypothetical protein